ncbi:hypothetical protein L9F63_000291 [Diploptera punctata]|uniref:Uncharacterized protein n=1 Tax=Diploptera punctata TaxID=6984 RepID=A0AAD8AM01_DIPPU|nr:hypothetical protein L9F63_000291 [Diploptera punctata]
MTSVSVQDPLTDTSKIEDLSSTVAFYVEVVEERRPTPSLKQEAQVTITERGGEKVPIPLIQVDEVSTPENSDEEEELTQFQVYSPTFETYIRRARSKEIRNKAMDIQGHASASQDTQSESVLSKRNVGKDSGSKQNNEESQKPSVENTENGVKIQVTSSATQSAASSANPLVQCRQVTVGWDKFKTKALIILVLGFIVWAAVFFPLLRTGNI